MRVGEEVVSDARSPIDHHMGQEYGVVADGDFFIDHYVGCNVRVLADFRGWCDHGCSVNPRGILRRLVEQFDGVRERQIGILAAQHRRRDRRKILSHDHGGGPRGAGRGGVLGIRDEGHLAGAGFFDSSYAGDFCVGRAVFQPDI